MSSNVEKAGGGFDSLGARAVAMGNLIASGVEKGIGMLQGLGGQALDAVTSFERMSAQLTALTAKELVDTGKFANFDSALSSAQEKTQDLLKWTQKLAIQSPFGERDISSVMGMASAFGFLTTQYKTTQEAQKAGVITAQRLTEAIMNFGAATGMSGATLSNIARVAGQIQATGKLMGGDSMQLKNFGINLEGAIGKALGKTQEQVIEMREKGLLPAKVALGALVGEMEKFGSAAALQGNSLGGLLASLSDLKEMALRNIFGPIFAGFQPALAAAVSALQDENVLAAMQNFGNWVGGGVSAALSFLGDLVSNAGAYLGDFVDLFNEVQASFASGGIGGGMASIAGVLGLGPEAQAGIESAVNGIVGVVQGAVGRLQNAVSGALANIAGGEGILAPGSFILGMLGMNGEGAEVPGLVSFVDGMMTSISDAFDRLKSGIGTAMSAFQSGMAGGTPGAAVSGFLSALGLSEDVAGAVGSGVASVLSAIQTAKDRLGGAVSGFLSGLAQGTPGVAVTNFLVAMGVSETLAGEIGSGVASVVGAIQAAKDRVLGVISAFQQGFASGGLAGGASAFLRALGLSDEVASGVGQVIGRIEQAVRGGIERVKTAFSALQSGGVGSFLSALGLDGVASQVQGVVNTITSVVGRIGPIFMQAAGPVLGFVAAVWGMAQLGGVISTVTGFFAVLAGAGVVGPLLLAGAVVAAFVAGVQSGMIRIGPILDQVQTAFAQTLAALQPIVPPALYLAQVVGGILVVAFTGLVGLVTGAMPGLANVVVGVFNLVSGAVHIVIGVLQLLGSVVVGLVTGDWSRAWETAKSGVVSIFTGIGQIIEGGLQVIVGAVRTFVGGVIGFFETLYMTLVGGSIIPDLVNEAIDWFTQLPGRAAQAIGSGIGQVVSAAQDLANQTLTAVSNMASRWADAGRGFVEALGNGIRSAAQSAIGAVQDVVSNIRSLLPGSDADRGPLSDLTASGRALPATFAAGIASGASLPGVSVEQIAAAIRGQLGGLVSVTQAVVEVVNGVIRSAGKTQKGGDLDRLANATGSIADVLKSFADISKILPQLHGLGTGSELRNTVAGFTIFVHDIVMAAGPARGNIGTDIPGPFKRLADSMGSVLGILQSLAATIKAVGDLAKSGLSNDSLPALSASVSFLAGAAATLVRDAVRAAQVVGQVDSSGLAPLKDAVDAVSGIASGTWQSVQTLASALAFDWSALPLSQVPGVFASLVAVVLAVIPGAQAAAASLKGLDLSGLAPLGQAANDARSISDGALGLVKSLSDALAFDWGSVEFSTARDMLTGLVVGVLYLIGPAVEAAQAIKSVVGADALGAVGSAASGAQSVASNTLSLVKTLAEALGFKWSEINFHAARDMLTGLATAAIYLITDAAAVAASIKNLDVSGLQPLGTAVSSALAGARDTWDLVKQLGDIMKAGGVHIDLRAAGAALIDLASAGLQLASDYLRVANTFSGQVKPNADTFASALSVTLSSTKNAWDLVSVLGEILKAGGVTLTYEDVIGPLWQLALIGERLSNDFLWIANTYEGTVAPNAETFGRALGVTLDATKKSWDLVSVLGEILKAGGVTLTYEDVIGPLWQLALIGERLSSDFLWIANTYEGGVAPNAETFSKALGVALSATKSSWDLVSLLSDVLKDGLSFDLEAGAGAVAQLATIGTRLANDFLTVANVYAGQVTPNAEAYEKALGLADSATSKAMSLVKGLADLIKAGGVTLTGEQLAGVLGGLLTVGTRLADAFLTVANVYAGAVAPNAEAYAKAVGLAQQASGNVISLVKGLVDLIKAGGVSLTGEQLSGVLSGLLTVGGQLADAFLTVANVYAGAVAPNAEAYAKALGLTQQASGNAISLYQALAAYIKDGGLGYTAAELVGAVSTLASTGGQLADAFLTVANTYTGQVTPAATAYGSALSLSNSAIGDGLSLLSALQKYSEDATAYTLADLVRLAKQIAQDGKSLTDAFMEIASTYNAAGNAAGSAFASGIGSASDGLTKGLTMITALVQGLPNYRGMTTALSSRLTALLDDLVAVLRAFGTEAASVDWDTISNEAMSNLSKGAGDAWSAISNTLEGVAKLVDPDRVRLPSAAQAGSLVAPIIEIMKVAVAQVAGLSSQIPADEMKAAQTNASAVGAVFEALSKTVEAIQNATGLAVGGSGINNLNTIITWVENLFSRLSTAFASGSDAAAAMAGISQMLANLGSLAGTTMGNNLVDSLAAAIRAGAPSIAAAMRETLGAAQPGAAGPGGPSSAPSGGRNGESGGGNKTINITINQYVTPQMILDPAGTLIHLKGVLA